MPQSTTTWFLKCLGFCLLGILVLNVIGRTITPALAWSLYHNDPTPGARNIFAMHYYLVLTALYGFLLGLIPQHQIRSAFISSFANFASRFDSAPEQELDFAQPILWAWLPIGIVFFLRFLSWQAPDHSVIAAATASRLEYFFLPPASINLNLLNHATQIWVCDRYLITGPTFFLLAYSFGIWFRYQFPSRPDHEPAAT
jgi:hypothetical protein